MTEDFDRVSDSQLLKNIDTIGTIVGGVSGAEAERAYRADMNGQTVEELRAGCYDC